MLDGFAGRLADREDHQYRLGEQPARHERQCLRGGPVEPLRVVDHAEQRALGGDDGEQGEHGQPDEKRVGCDAGLEAEGGAQGVA